jgi:hypothetical protein
MVVSIAMEPKITTRAGGHTFSLVVEMDVVEEKLLSRGKKVYY